MYLCISLCVHAHCCILYIGLVGVWAFVCSYVYWHILSCMYVRGLLCVYVFLCDCVDVCVSKTVSWDFNDRIMHLCMCILVYMWLFVLVCVLVTVSWNFSDRSMCLCMCLCISMCLCVHVCVWECVYPVCLHILFYVHICKGILSHVSACVSLWLSPGTLVLECVCIHVNA